MIRELLLMVLLCSGLVLADNISLDSFADELEDQLADSVVLLNESFYWQANKLNQSVNASNQAVMKLVNNLCGNNPYIKEAENGSSITFQKTLEAAMGNNFDAKFADQQDWLKMTLLPSTEELNRLKDERSSLETELLLCQNELSTKESVHNSTVTELGTRMDLAADREGNWMLIAALLGVLLVVTNLDLLKKFRGGD